MYGILISLCVEKSGYMSKSSVIKSENIKYGEVVKLETLDTDSTQERLANLEKLMGIMMNSLGEIQNRIIR